MRVEISELGTHGVSLQCRSGATVQGNLMWARYSAAVRTALLTLPLLIVICSLAGRHSRSCLDVCRHRHCEHAAAQHYGPVVLTRLIAVDISGLSFH